MNRRASRRAGLAAALAVSGAMATIVTAAPVVHAQTQASADDAQRAELYREAVRAASAGRWAEAKERLRAVLAIRPSPKVYFSLAQSEEQLGQLASAQADYARALEGGATEGKGDVVKAAELAQRALLPRVPHVRIVVSSADGARGTGLGATATLDDHAVPVGALVAVDPGAHRLAVSAPSMRTVTSSVRVIEGQQLDVPVSLEAERGAASASAASPPLSVAASTRANAASGDRTAPRDDERDDGSAHAASRSTAWRTAGVVTAGVGVVALGVGVVFGLDAKSKHDAAATACPDTCANANDAKLWSDAVRAGNLSTVAFVVAGVGVVGGAVLWFAAPSSAGSSTARASTRLGIGPGSVQLHGAW